MNFENTAAISIISATLTFDYPCNRPLNEWLNSPVTAPPQVIEAKVQINSDLESSVVCLLVEEAIKLQLPQICSKHPDLIQQEWRVNNLTLLGGTRSLFQTTQGTYRVKDIMKPIHQEGDIATFALIPTVYDELSPFQRSLWKVGLDYLKIQGVPLYRMWLDANGDVLYLHLKSRDPLPPISDNHIYDWLQLGTPIDLMKIGEPAVRSYPTFRSSSGTINNLEIAIPLNGTELLVGNVITADPTSAAPTPTPSCKNCLQFGGATPPTLEDPGEEPDCQHPERESFPAVDSTEEDAAIDLGSDAIWELYADGCPGYQWRDPNQAQEPDDLPMLNEQDLAIANQLETDLLNQGPGQEFVYPLLRLQGDWMTPNRLLYEGRNYNPQRSSCKFLTPVEAAYLNQHSVRMVELKRQVGGDRSPMPTLTTIVVNTPEGDRCFQFNGAYIDELVPADGKVQRVAIRSTKGELWYDQEHLEVMQALHALENAIRRLVGVPEENWEDEPIIDEFGVPIVGIASDASDVQQVFE